MIKNIVNFIKSDVVLVVSWILAIASMFVVKPSKEYFDYIDWRSLGILWSLMIIMQMMQKHGVFAFLGHKLLNKTKRVWQLAAVLIGLCFFFSMFITNDVALITFVPFAIMLLDQCDKKEITIIVVVLQTIAANLGSMLTPVGNPQNLYLYGLEDMSVFAFVKLMLPYAGVSFVLLIISILFVKGKAETIDIAEDISVSIENKLVVGVYFVLFLIALVTVARFIPFYILVAIVLIATLICGKKILLKADYALLLTFVGFFIFTGNMGNYEAVSTFLENIVAGHETIIGVAVSQGISNVPAALLLSKFTEDIPALIIGVNLGGLGTLIASMASLISFKLYANTMNAKKGLYLLVFTVANIAYLLILLGFYTFLN